MLIGVLDCTVLSVVGLLKNCTKCHHLETNFVCPQICVKKKKNSVTYLP